MIKIGYKIFIYLAGLLLISSCSYDFPVAPEDPEIDLGNLNFDRFIVLGGVASAGLMDGALYDEGQNSAYPAQIAAEIEEQAGEDIYAPIPVNSEYGKNIFTSNSSSALEGKFYLSYRNPTQEWPARRTEDGEEVEDYTGSLSNVNNYSIPGIRVYDVDDEISLSGNIYFERLTQRESDESILDLALAIDPTLFVLELGTDEIFSYAVNGASGETDPDPNNISADDLTPISVFEQELDTHIDRILNESSTDLFLVNIPDPFLFPYFTKLFWYFSQNEWGAVRDNFNFASYDEFNTDVQEYNRTVTDFNKRRPLIVFDSNGGSAFRAKVIIDEYLEDAQNNDGQDIPKYRQMTKDDYFLYNAEALHSNSFNDLPILGTENPISDRYIITKREAEIITERREAFNAKIKSISDDNPRVHLIDYSGMIEAIYNEEVNFNGVTYSLDFDNRTIISADGFTLNARGQALLANEFIFVMNKNFDSKIGYIDVNNRKGTDFELGF